MRSFRRLCAAAVVLMLAAPCPTRAFQLHTGLCARSVHDASGSGLCLKASSVPTGGMLLPLGPFFFVDPSGRVGLGTMTPSGALDLRFAGSDGIRVDSTNGSAPSLKLYQAGLEKTTFHANSGDSYLGTTGGDTMHVITNNVSRIQVNASGKVAIGPNLGGPTQVPFCHIYDPQSAAGSIVLAVGANPNAAAIRVGGSGLVVIDGPNTPYGRLVVAENGNVGIQQLSATPANILTLGQGKGHAIADGWDVYSSRRFKQNVEPIADPLAKVLALRPVTFDWIATGRRDLGFIAEEVVEVVPEVVDLEGDGVQARSLDYARLTAVLAGAVQEQQRLLDAQEERIRRLEAGLEAVLAREAGR